jgi:hypothetical protein
MSNPEQDEDVVETYLTGKCFALAYALSARYGWPIQAKAESFSDGAEYAAHVWVLHPSGQALDIMGFSDPGAMAATNGTPDGRVVDFSLEDFVEFAEVNDDDPLDTFWHDVDEADALIDDYIVPTHLGGILPSAAG